MRPGLGDEERKTLWLKERQNVGTLKDPQFAKAVEVLGKKIAAQNSTRAEKSKK